MAFCECTTKPHRVNQYNQRAFGKFNNYCKLFSIKWFERSFLLCQADTAAMSHRSWETFLQLSSDKVNFVLRGRLEKKIKVVGERFWQRRKITFLWNHFFFSKNNSRKTKISFLVFKKSCWKGIQRCLNEIFGLKLLKCLVNQMHCILYQKLSSSGILRNSTVLPIQSVV